MLQRTQKVVVFGGGSFGTAVGTAIARQKADLAVSLLLRDPYICKAINETHRNTRYLAVRTNSHGCLPLLSRPVSYKRAGCFEQHRDIKRDLPPIVTRDEAACLLKTLTMMLRRCRTTRCLQM